MSLQNISHGRVHHWSIPRTTLGGEAEESQLCGPPEDENFDAPDADIILRALGPPKHDFRVYKLLLSLASPLSKHKKSSKSRSPRTRWTSSD